MKANKTSESFYNFAQTSGMIDLFIIYLKKSEHPSNENIKDDILSEYDKMSKDDFKNNYIKEYLRLSDSEAIFDFKEYEEFFSQMAYSNLIDNCLCYFKDILVEIIKIKPQILKSREKEELSYILSFDSMESLINDITEKRINKLFYSGITEIEKFFLDRLNIELFEDGNLKKDFNQLIKQRNVIVHNKGIISKELANEFKEYKGHLGKRLYFSYDRLMKINWLIADFLFELDTKLIKKYSLSQHQLF